MEATDQSKAGSPLEDRFLPMDKVGGQTQDRHQILMAAREQGLPQNHIQARKALQDKNQSTAILSLTEGPGTKTKARRPQMTFSMPIPRIAGHLVSRTESLLPIDVLFRTGIKRTTPTCKMKMLGFPRSGLELV
jgi:hypothetical protein